MVGGGGVGWGGGGYGCECLCNVLGTYQSYSTSDPGQVTGYFTVYLRSYQHRVRRVTAPHNYILIIKNGLLEG